MAADVHRRGHGRSLEGLSVVAGAAHLIPADAGPKNNAQALAARATYQQYVGVSSSAGDVAAGQLQARHKLDSFGPKLVQGDYTYTTSRKSLLVSSQLVGGGSLPPGGTAPSSAPSSSSLPPRNTIPAMVPINAGNINTAAWKAYGSPSARTHLRPPLAPGTANTNPMGGGVAGAPVSPTGNRLPRVGGFKARRPQSAPGVGGADGIADLGPVIAAIASTVSVGTTGRRGGKGATEMLDVGVLAVEHPDPIRAGRTDSGRVMFEYTLPTDPYAKYVWEEQARKARTNMSRHVAAMAAAAAVNGGSAFSHGGPGVSAGGGGGGGSRPGSATRGALGVTAAAAAAAAAGGPGTLGGASAAAASRPRFSSTTIADVARQGTDHRPPTVLGFAAPDLTEDGTMPGPGDPRWAYTRLGRTQIARLQHSLKMAAYHPRLATRPSSAPALGGGGGGGGGAAAGTAASGAVTGVGVGTDTSCGAVGVGSSERSLVQPELSVLDPFSDPTSGAAAAAAAVGGDGGRPSEAHMLEAQRSSPVSMLRTASGSGGTRPGSAGRARPGSATYGRAPSGGLVRAGSPGLPRPGSASLIRAGSVSGAGALGASASLAAVLAAEASSVAAAAAAAAAVPPVRGASAGRTREAAPNPRVDLRAYLADAEADAEEDDEGTEMLPVGDLAAAAASGGLVYDGASGAVLLDGVPVTVPVPPEVLQSMPVPADQLAARLAEMVAAVAVVAAQKQLDGECGDDGGDGAAVDVPEAQPRVHFEEVVVDDVGPAKAPAEPAPAPPAPSAAEPPSPLPQRFSRPDGDDALLALHGASNFGRGPGRFGNNAVDFAAARSGSGSGASQYDSDGIADWGDDEAAPPLEQPLGLGLGLAPRPVRGGGGGRPMSARPMSARPMSARPTSAMPGRRSGSPTRSLGEGGLEGGMDVIMEQEEDAMGED